MTDIGLNAFRNCSNLTSVEFLGSGKSVQLKIASGAFHSCSGLRKVTLPENLVSLGKYAFGYCTNLTEVEVYATASKPDETDSSVMLCTALETDAFRTDVAWDKDKLTA